MSYERIQLGKQGENLVACYLEKQGFTIIAKNYKVTYGEIDLIAHKGDVLAFIEVKLRRNPLFCLTDLITYSKQRKIIKTALHYISTKNSTRDVVYRFDVALLEPQGDDFEIRYIENAFTASE